MTMKRDCLIVMGGLIPVGLIPLLPQQLWVGAFILLILLGIGLIAVLIPGLGEMERNRELQIRDRARLSSTTGRFWVARQSFRDQ
jgi:hypothetical protein